MGCGGSSSTTTEDEGPEGTGYDPSGESHATNASSQPGTSKITPSSAEPSTSPTKSSPAKRTSKEGSGPTTKNDTQTSMPSSKPKIETRTSVTAARQMWEQRASVAAMDAQKSLPKSKTPTGASGKRNSNLSTRRASAKSGHARKRSRSLGNIATGLGTLSEKPGDPSARTIGGSRPPSSASSGRKSLISVSPVKSSDPMRQKRATIGGPYLSPTSIDAGDRGYHSDGGGTTTVASAKKRMSLRDRMAAYQQDIEDTESKSRERAASHARDRRKTDVGIDQAQKKRASVLLTDYAKRKSVISKERGEIDAIFGFSSTTATSSEATESFPIGSAVSRSSAVSGEAVISSSSSSTSAGLAREDAVNALEKLNILVPIFVHRNQYKRWSERSKSVYYAWRTGRWDDPIEEDEQKSVDELKKGRIVDDDLEKEIREKIKVRKQMQQECKDLDNRVEMRVLTLQNSSILKELTKEQREQFKQAVLWCIEDCPLLYSLNLTQCELTNAFMERVMSSLMNRFRQSMFESGGMEPPAVWTDDSKDIGKDERQRFFGPEQVHFENNPISDRGIESSLPMIEMNHPFLRLLRMGHSFGSISTKTASLVAGSVSKNTTLLKLNVDLRYRQHSSAVDKAINRNADLFRASKRAFEAIGSE